MESDKRFGKMMMNAMNDVGKKRSYMADVMGVSTKTIFNWENGFSYPTVKQFFDWFDELNVNQKAYITQEFTNDSNEKMNDKEIKKRLHDEVDNATPRQRALMHFIQCGQHSGDFDALLNLMVAYLQTNWKDRIAQSALIMTNYRLNKEKKEHPILPNVELVDKSIQECSKEFVQGREGYKLRKGE